MTVDFDAYSRPLSREEAEDLLSKPRTVERGSRMKDLVDWFLNTGDSSRVLDPTALPVERGDNQGKNRTTAQAAQLIKSYVRGVFKAGGELGVWADPSPEGVVIYHRDVESIRTELETNAKAAEAARAAGKRSPGRPRRSAAPEVE
jgi:hypothetical protein